MILNDVIELRRSGSVYRDIKTDDIYFIKSVDRDYQKAKKRPDYYIQKKQGNKLIYLSGLFRGKNNVYSMDIKDNFGIKILYDVYFESGGSEIKIIKKHS